MGVEGQAETSPQAFVHSPWDQRLNWKDFLILSSREAASAAKVEDAVEMAVLNSENISPAPCSRCSLGRAPKPGVTDLHTSLMSWGHPRLLHEDILTVPSRSPPWTANILEWPDGVLTIAPNFGRSATVATYYSFTIVGRQPWVWALHKLILELTSAPEPKLEANTHVLGQASYGNKLCFRELPSVGTALIRENYTSEVLEILDHTITDLLSPGPCGRLSILHGPPGTGKTFALRGVLWALHKDPSIKCVLIPSSTIQSLADPGIIDVFLDSSSRDDNPSIPPRHVLLIEDADEALVSRGADNLSTLSSLLNITDGLLGQALDIRVLATTNATKTDIDPAVTRAGRLCSNISLGPLPFLEAVAIAERLGRPALDKAKKAWTLAEIYSWKGVSHQSTGEKRLMFFPPGFCPREEDT